MTRLLAVKLRRDLRASWSRFALMALAIAISLVVFGAVLLAWSGSRRETAAAYAGTEPASATILLDRPVEPARLAELAAAARNRPGVIAATGRSQLDSEVRVGGQVLDIPLQAFVAAPDDPMRLARFSGQNRGWPPAADEIYLAEDSLGLLGVSVGDVLTLEPPGGRPVTVRVADTVYDPSLSPSAQEQTARGYLSTAAVSTGLDQLKLQVADPGGRTPTRDRDTAVAVAGQIGDWLQREQGLAVREIQVPVPYKHPHQWQADSLLGSLLTGGAIALLLSSILVATMLNNLFTQQIPQIGIMKAIGARPGRIGRFYRAMTLLVATVATLVAVPVAILIGRWSVRLFLGMLGIRPVSVGAPVWAYLVVIAVGVAVPPLMASVPVVRAGRTTVRAAIDHRGLGTGPTRAAGPLGRIAGLRRLNRGLLMAIRNTVRRPARFALSAGLLASAGTVFVAGMSLGSGVQAVGDQPRQRPWDVDVQLAAPADSARVIDALRPVPGIVKVEGLGSAKTGVSGPGRIPITRTYPDQGHGRVVVTAVPAGATLFTPPPLLEGRWLEPGETGAVILNQVVRKNSLPGVRAGDTVQLSVGGRPSSWRVVGIAQERGGGRGGVYATTEGLAAATGQPARVNQLSIVTASHDEASRSAVAAAAGRSLSAAGVQVKSAASVTRTATISAEHMGPMVAIVLTIAIAMGVVGGIGLASTMSANVLDRLREFGIMHAIGARPKVVRRIVVTEGLLVALASCVLAVVPALLLTWLLGAGLGNLFFAAPLPYRISAPAVGIWVLLVVLGAGLATDGAASRASRLTVREVLAGD